MNVGLDIDGVVYPWHWSMYRYFVENRGFSGTQREFWTYFKSLPQEEASCYLSLEHLYMDTTPTQDVMTYVPKIAEIADIYYITNRKDELKFVTQKFFDKYQLPFKENLIFTSDKANYVRLHRIEKFLDDRPPNVDELIGITDVYLFKAVHNWEDRERYTLVNNMKEFYEIVRNDGRRG